MANSIPLTLADFLKERPSSTLIRVTKETLAICNRSGGPSVTVRAKSFRGVFGDDYNYRAVSISLRRLAYYGLIEKMPSEARSGVNRYVVIKDKFITSAKEALLINGSRKLGNTHQYVLIFVKGNPKLATEACGTNVVEVTNSELGEWVE